MTCSGPECGKLDFRRGLCCGHLKQLQRYPDRPLRPLKPPKGGVLTPQEQFDNAVAEFGTLPPSDRRAWRLARKRVREASIRLFLSMGDAARERAWARLQEAIFTYYEVPSHDDESAARARARLLKRAVQYGSAMRRTPTKRTPRPRAG